MSEKDAEMIGWEEAYCIMTLREMRNGGRGFTFRSSSRAGTNTTEEEIRKSFKTELSFINAAAAPYTQMPPSPTPTVCSCGCGEKASPDWSV